MSIKIYVKYVKNNRDFHTTKLNLPTSGLDGTNMRNVSRMIRKLAKMGRTIIVITHDAECALACCERAIRLENGCITDDFQIRGTELLLDKIGYDKKEG